MGGLKGWAGVNSCNTCCNGVYGHPCGGRCGDRWTASHEYEVQTLLTFHFMAISVAWDARPEKKVKFSALLHIICTKNTTIRQTFSPRVADP